MQDEAHLLELIQTRNEVEEVKLTRPRRITVSVSADNYHAIVKFLAENGINHVITMTALDNGRELEVMLNLGRSTAVTVRTLVPMEKPELESVSDVLPSVSFNEREVHDLLGIVFRHSPDLSRVVLPDDWPEGVYPLRKSFTPEIPKPVRGT
jgi:Ni,Fe-hydrogenase III component G